MAVVDVHVTDHHLPSGDSTAANGSKPFPLVGDFLRRLFFIGVKESQQGISGPGRAQNNADIKQTKITYPGLSKLC